jgi:5'(3')-deoxyribonucleotidase
MPKYTKKPTIYLDMDGVLADFNSAARRFLSASREEEQAAAQGGRWPQEKWRQLAQQQNFYRHLPKTPIADRLVALAQTFEASLGWDLRILTAIPKDNDMPEVFQDKFDWVNEYYPGLRIHFGPYSDDKQHHCQPGDILVDDRTSNCTQWRASGGIAVQVFESRQESALQELSALFQETLTLSFI